VARVWCIRSKEPALRRSRLERDQLVWIARASVAPCRALESQQCSAMARDGDRAHTDALKEQERGFAQQPGSLVSPAEPRWCGAVRANDARPPPDPERGRERRVWLRSSMASCSSACLVFAAAVFQPAPLAIRWRVGHVLPLRLKRAAGGPLSIGGRCSSFAMAALGSAAPLPRQRPSRSPAVHRRRQLPRRHRAHPPRADNGQPGGANTAKPRPPAVRPSHGTRHILDPRGHTRLRPRKCFPSPRRS